MRALTQSHCTTLRTAIAVLVVALMSSPVALGQDDFDDLYKQGRQAYEAGDYLKAYGNLFAYWSVLRREYWIGEESDTDFYNEVVAAVLYSEAQVEQEMDRLRNRVRSLDNELAQCKGSVIRSTAQMMTAPGGPPLRERPPDEKEPER